MPHHGTRCLTGLGGLALMIGCAAGPAFGDLLRFKNGRVLDGQILSDTGDEYRVKLMQGVIDVPKADVVKREPLDPPWVRLEQERARHPDTPQGHYDVAMWCKAQGLIAEMRVELRRAVEQDPDFAEARTELGQVRRNGQWVPAAPSKARVVSPQDRAMKEEEAQTRKAITTLVTRVRQIRKNKLEGGGRDESSDLFQAGRKQILSLKDPLAIAAIASVLSGGTEPSRRLMIEALERFPQDEATLNLLAATVVDPSPGIRRLAAEALARRKDARMVTELRAALKSDEDQIKRNAAAALGVLHAEEAIPDLIGLLDVAGYTTMVIQRPALWASFCNCYCGPTVGYGGGAPLWYYPTGIAVLAPGTVLGTHWEGDVEVIKLYRTDVQEALIEITGQNFGFDIPAWRRWYIQKYKPKTSRPAR